MKTNIVVSLVAACLAAAFSVHLLMAEGADPVVVVNPGNPVTSLTKAQVRKMLTGAQTKWPNGEKVVVMTPMPGSPERNNALRVFCDMSEKQFNAEIIHAGFTGDERVPPRTMPSGKAVVGVVQLVKGGIGVVDPADVTPAVKVVPISD